MEIHPSRLVTLPIFRGVPLGDIALLAASCAGFRYTRGDVLFEEGDRATHAFLIVVGRLGVYVGSPDAERLVSEGKPGEVIGESGLLDPEARRIATVRAVTDCDVLAISPETMLALGSSRAMVAIELSVLSAMARRTRAANARLEAALSATRPEPARIEAARPTRTAGPPAPARSEPVTETLTQTLLRILRGK
jgi:CRP-like cAMP-binding protein